MQFVARLGIAASQVSLLVVLAGLLVGCDSANEGTTTKPIESNILKKLGEAGKAQSDAALEKRPGKVQDAVGSKK